MAKELFGTDGIRGTPGQYPLDDKTLYWVGHSVGSHLSATASSPRVLLGMDTRESGPHIAGLLSHGLAQAGARPVSVGVITTPGVAHLVHTGDFSAGVVISASHNPFQDNGVKLFSHAGMKFPDAVEEAIETTLLAAKDGPVPAGNSPPVSENSLGQTYVKYLAGRALPGAKLAGMKIVLDCSNGAASRLAPELFRSLGADVTAIHNTPDGRNINAGCGSMHPEAMQKKVLETGAALGVAFDGDADRAIFADARGRLINGDGVLLAVARYLKSTGQLKGGAIVGTTMTNLGLERILAAEGFRIERADVGDRYVLEKMQRLGANLGGEQSGHIIFLDDATTGDGLLTAVKIASLVALRGPLDAQISGLKNYPQRIVNVCVRAKPALETLAGVARALADANAALGASGRIVLRYSGTEQLARVMVEAERAEDVDHWSSALADAIRSAIGI